MSGQLWSDVDDYLGPLFAPHDDALEHALAASTTAGLPAIQVSATQGKLLHVFARMLGAKRVLEIGTLGGYSTIWMARALPADGALVSLEIDPAHANVARANLARAGLDRIATVRVGPALDSLAALVAAGEAPFDFAFIDADKPALADYFAWAMKLVRPGGAIVADNVVRKGAVIDAASDDPSVQGVRRLNALVAGEPRVEATTLQTVGAKGWDGFLLAWVRAS